MKKVFCLVIVVCGVALLGCGTAYHTYRSDMDAGKKLLNTGDYSQAREDFIGAGKAHPAEPASYALAATASYKMNDLQAASRSITEAVKRDNHSDAYIRILGYKALILLRQGREKEGLDALHAYIVAYEREYGPQNVRKVRAVWRSAHIDLPALESVLDGQIAVYESDMQQFRSSGTGWFAEKYGPTTPSTSR
jgi:tetratricopeptide (TPR) repeat protein